MADAQYTDVALTPEQAQSLAGPHIGPIPDDAPVTLGDLMDDPRSAIARMGTILKRDASDPKTWMTIAAAYFGPKVLSKAAPMVAQAMRRPAEVAPSGGTPAPGMIRRVGAVLEPGDVGIFSPRLGKVVDLAQRVRGAVSPPPEPVTAQSPVEAPPASAPAPAASAPVSAAPSSPAPTRGAAPALTLTADEQQAVQGLIQQGYREADVLEAIAQQRQAAPAAPTTKVSLKADESKEYIRLRNKGQSHQQAMEVIDGQRALKQRLGLADGETVRKAVVSRNDSGRWTE